jgi:hypothetical protein
MKDDAADHLHVVMPLPERPPRGLANGGEGFGKDLVQRLAVGEPLTKICVWWRSSSSVIAEMVCSKPLIRSTIFWRDRTYRSFDDPKIALANPPIMKRFLSCRVLHGARHPQAPSKAG